MQFYRVNDSVIVNTTLSKCIVVKKGMVVGILTRVDVLGSVMCAASVLALVSYLARIISTDYQIFLLILVHPSMYPSVVQLE